MCIITAIVLLGLIVIGLCIYEAHQYPIQD